MTLILLFNGSSGSSVLLSFISAPEPSAPQSSSLTPLPINRTPKRFGNCAGAVVSANAGRDSSHGSAIATPAPRRIVRREIRSVDFFVRFDILFAFLLYGFSASFVPELRAHDNRFDQRSEPVTVRDRHVSHLQHHRLVR